MPSSLLFRAPSLALLATEPLRAVLEFCAVKLDQPPLVQGDGHSVIVYPGLGAGALATAPLRQHLQACGFDVHDWDQGVNTGPEGAFDEWLAPLVQRVRELHALHGRKASLVGWSLGGVYAREIAKCCPESVRQVVTLATPHNAIGDANHAGTFYRLFGGDTSQLTPEVIERVSARPPVPLTAVYSKADGVVSWRGCLEQPGPDVENVAVQASHLGMPTHTEVLRVVADRLAQPEGRWRPYRRRLRLSSPATGSSRSTR
jgi:pimeloyl-ACP methyl ester carboxylesterase